MILVVGATGRLGGMITNQLLAQGKEVRIFVRENSPAAEMAKIGMATDPQSLIDAGAQPVYGDLKDRASIDPAVTGVDTVITTANTIIRGGEDNLETVDLQGTIELIDAAKAAGVRRFIYISANGADQDHPGRLFQIKATCEDRINESGMTFTSIRPTVLMEVWIGSIVGPPLQAGQPVSLVGDGNHKNAFVCMQDVAAYAATSVDNPLAVNQTIVVSGPDSYTWNEIVQAVGQVFGQELPVNYVVFGEPIPIINPNVAELFNGMEMRPEVFVDMSDTSARYGIKPTPLSTAMQRMFGG